MPRIRLTLLILLSVGAALVAYRISDRSNPASSSVSVSHSLPGTSRDLGSSRWVSSGAAPLEASPRPRLLRGVVRDPDGGALGGGTVMWEWDEMRRSYPKPKHGSVNVDASGAFEIVLTCEGVICLVSGHDDFVQPKPLFVSVGAGAPDEIVIEMARSHSLVGRVISRDGTSPTGFSVTASLFDSKASGGGKQVFLLPRDGNWASTDSDRTDGNGEFELTGALPGHTYWVRVKGPVGPAVRVIGDSRTPIVVEVGVPVVHQNPPGADAQAPGR